MKTTKKQLKEIQEIEKMVAEVCDAKKTTEVTRDENNVITDKETGEPHFPSSREIEIKLSFGENSPRLKYQLKEHGFTLPKKILKDAETIRIDLLALNQAGILSSKQLWKCFKKLSKQISKMVVNAEIKDGEIATHLETKIG